MLSTRLPDLVWILLTYGEDEVAEWAKTSTPDQQARVWEIAGNHMGMPSGSKAGSGMLFAKAIALAAVEVAEGVARPLTWGRRKLDRERPDVPPQTPSWLRLDSN